MSPQSKNIAVWTLYDFANSVVEIVFFLYFAQWLVVDHGMSDLSYNMLFAIGSLLLVITAPIFAAMADKTGKEHRYLNRITILTFLSFLGATMITLFWSNQVIIAALFFLFANYFYQFSFVFYNAMLHSLAPPNKWAKISGLGQTANWLGQIAGLLITLPFAAGSVYLFGEAGRAQTFMPVVLLFMVLALPMLLYFKSPSRIQVAHSVSIKSLAKSQWSEFKKLLKAPGMKYFLLAYFLFNDAIITSSNNFPIYLEQVFAFSDTNKSLLLMAILVTSAIGAYCSGAVAERIGLRKSLMIVLGSWVILFPLLGITTNLSLFIALTIAMGFLFGAIWTVTRAAMTALCPKEQLNFGFSFYTLAERVSTLIGPLSWGLITTLLVHLGPTRYRLAMMAMAIFVALGIVFLRKVEMKNTAFVEPATSSPSTSS